MDTLLLSSIRRWLGSAANQEAFDKAFGLPSLDGYGNCIGSIDVLNKGERSFLNPYDLLSDILRVRTKGIDDDFELIAAVAAAVLSRNFRGDFLVRQRLKWSQHVRRLEREGMFRKMYRMSVTSFDKLVNLLRPWLQVNLKQSRNASKGNQPIVPEIIMHCTLRYLAGGALHDIRVCAGLSVSSFYRAVRRGIDAVNACSSLAIKFPVTIDELMTSASEFERLSSHGIINGCIGAVDGWLCQIRVPSAHEVTRVKSYFSGHYQCYGVNVQATCDARCRFTSLSVICPSATLDSKSFYASNIYNTISQLPAGFFVVGDNAYTLSSTLLIPYSGATKLNPSRDAFNFFLSQLRIRIEQAFGMLVMKWRIFKRPLEVKFWRTTIIIEAAFRLHNFCINNNECADMISAPCNPESFAPSYVEHLDPLEDAVEGSKKRLVDLIKSDGRVRPRHNIIRNSF